MAKNRGVHLACRCHICYQFDETNHHLFFSYNLAKEFWSWLLRHCGCYLTAPTHVAIIWEAISTAVDVSGKKWAAATFFQAIYILWYLRNDPKHNNRLPTSTRAKVLFVDRMKGRISSLPTAKVSLHPQPILVFLDIT